MARDLIAHRWTCPICSETKTGLASMETMDVERQAEHSLLSHVRTRDGGGHGPGGTLPPDFDPDDVLDFVEVQSENEGRPGGMNAVR